MSIQEPDNPFQSPATITDAVEVDPQQVPLEKDEIVLATVKAAVRWFLICGISAIPSWVIAASIPAAAAGMATGVLIFIVGYTIFDVWTRNHPLRQDLNVKWTLWITYGTRMGISILFPVGFFVDMFCGMLAMSATGALIGGRYYADSPDLGFIPSLVTTLIQGCLLNAVLAVYGLVIYGIFVAVSRATYPPGT